MKPKTTVYLSQKQKDQKLLQQLINQIWGADIQSVQSGLTTRFFFDDSLRLPEIRLLAVGIVIALGIGLAFFLKSTRMGRAIRATVGR